MGTIISDLTEGAAKGLFSGIGSLARDIRIAITGKDPAKLAELEMKLTELEAAGMQAQAKINEIEAAHPSVFVSGWRPAAGWVCVFGMGYQFVVRPLLSWISEIVGWKIPPDLAVDTLMTLLFGMLGLGAYRTYERSKGIART